MMLRSPPAWFLAALVACIRMIRVGGAVAGQTVNGAWLVAPDLTPLQTAGRYIVNRRGERVKWACANWGGAYSRRHVVGGLEAQNLDFIAGRVRELGFNCVRLPYSTEGYRDNPAVLDEDLAANPNLQSANGTATRFLELFDAVVQAVTAQGLMVIINNHNHVSGWCCNIMQDEGLWYTPGYNESIWIDSLVFFAQRYRNNKLVVGYDLRNEPHNYHPPGGARIELTWGDGNPTTDWAAAAKRAGDAVLAANPDVLIVVEALCFAMELRPLVDHQIQLTHPNRIVYESHNYMEFQMQGLVSSRFVGWIEVRNVTFTTFFILLGVILVMGYLWWWFGKPRPPLAFLAITLGLWFTFLSVLGMVMAIFMYTFYREYCTQVAERDILPWLVFTSISTVVSLVLLMVGCVTVGCRKKSQEEGAAREVPHDAEEAATVDVADVDVDVANVDSAEIESRPSSRKRGSCCGKKGFTSCGLARRFFAQTAASMSANSWSSSVPKPGRVDWDWGLSIGLHFFVGAIIFWFIIALVFVWAHIFPSYWWLERHFDSTFGFALEHGQPWTAPIWMGEFGVLSPGNYWNNLLRYMSYRDLDWAYWPLNGLKYVEGYLDENYQWVDFDVPKFESDLFSILMPDAEMVRGPWRLLGLQAIMQSPARWNEGERACTRDSKWDEHLGGNSCGG